jgi:hypothetical protein
MLLLLHEALEKRSRYRLMECRCRNVCFSRGARQELQERIQELQGERQSGLKRVSSVAVAAAAAAAAIVTVKV